MRVYACPACGARLFFGALHCLGCGAAPVYDPERDAYAEGPPCANRDGIGCDWIAGTSGFCRACAMTGTIPDLGPGENRRLWADTEAAKRWTLAALGRWGWYRDADPGPRPVFHLLSETTSGGPEPVTMGHAAGVVTINVTEADPAERVARREALKERLRTLAGHFRHEIAHALFERLAARVGFVERFREIFGDEREDYGAALQRHYADGPPEGWRGRFITAYATAHPHEDWAECAAHAMHLTDMLDSAVATGLEGRGLPRPGTDVYARRAAAWVLARAARLGIAINQINRSIGLPDPYPFVLTAGVRRKLAFAHRWLAAGPEGAA